ncbi:50S ribosomal protein L1 [Candidatus Uhrbacteria bacterium]|nr:50S ribosomal protein L1 [Candidatus Uhrbacteria bacterium]
MSKRYDAAAKLVDPKRSYGPAEAVELAKKTANTKFDSSIELHANLGIDPKKGDQQVRGSIDLPHGTGKTKKVAVFCGPDKEKEAQEAGADVIGGKELIDEIKKTGKFDFEVAVATPAMMKDLAAVAKILGPKGMMPSPKNETVTEKIKDTVTKLKKGKITFKNDDTANIHLMIGKASFDSTKLLENLNACIDAIKKAKPSSSKGVYMKTLVLTSSMGPAVKVSA